MRPAHLSYEIFTWLCVCRPTDKSKWIRYRNYLFTVISMITFIVTFIASERYFVKFVSEDLEKAFYSVLNMLSASEQFYSCVAVLILRKNFEDIFFEYERFCGKRKHFFFFFEF